MATPTTPVVADDSAVPAGHPGLNLPALGPVTTHVSGIALCAALGLGLARWPMLPLLQFTDPNFLIEGNLFMKVVKMTALLAPPAALGLAIYLDGLRRGLAKQIPLGSHGAPTFAGKRLTIFGHVLDEGKQWIPFGFDHQPVDTRKRPFIKAMKEHLEIQEVEGEDDRGELLVIASAKSSTPEGVQDPTGVTVQHVPTLMFIKVSGTVQIVNEMLYISSDDPWLILKNELEGSVRTYVRGQDPIKLLDLKEELNDEVEAHMQEVGARFGIYFHDLTVTDIRFPKEVEEAAAKYLVEKGQRDAELYQIETFRLAVTKMREIFPHLDDQEVRNAVFVAAKLADHKVISLESAGGGRGKGRHRGRGQPPQPTVLVDASDNNRNAA